MEIIRRLNIFDKNKLAKMTAELACNFNYNFAKEFISICQFPLPLKMKFLPESFVYEQDGEIKGMISVVTAHGNPYRINIKRLLFRVNDDYAGKELINYVIGHYGAMGAKTFKVVIDDKQKDLEHLFTQGCGFRCGSWENLWDITPDIKRFNKITPINFKTAGDSHSTKIAELVNAELITLYKPTMQQNDTEFKSPLLKVFSSDWENSYVLIRSKNAVAYMTIKTTDNKNFIITVIKNSGYKLDFDRLISFALKTIQDKRASKFHAYVRQRKCFCFERELEEYLHRKKYKCVQTQHVLIKDFYRPIKEEYKSFIFSEGNLINN